MMLNALKNNEIQNFFSEQKAGASVEWSDLDLIQQQLVERGDRFNDLELEKIIFAEERNPFFSGFTESRVQKYSKEFGFSCEIKTGSQSFQKSGKLSLLESSSVSKKSIHIARRIRQRERRRKLKAKGIETFCRLREPFRLRILNQTPLRLNLGAGLESYPGWVKIDWAGPQDLFDNIVSLTKIKNNSVDEIYSNHVLEHIPPSLIPKLLNRWRDVLKPGGVLRLRMPDAKAAILHLHHQWSEVTEDAVSELGFPPYLSKERERSGIIEDLLAIQFIYGWSDSMPNYWDLSNQHKSLWTPSLGRSRLEASGFRVELAKNVGTLQTVLIGRKPI